MEYIIGGVIVLIVILVMNARAARTRVRNSDPLQQELLVALASRVSGQITDEDLDQIIQAVSDQALSSPHNVGDTIQDRLVHAASMAPMHYADRNLVSAIRKLARNKYVKM